MDIKKRALDVLEAIDCDVAVVGSINADLTVKVDQFARPGETIKGSALKILPGGKSANQAVAAALVGASTTFCGAIGDDANGSFVAGKLKERGVDITRVLVRDIATGTAMIIVDAEGENQIIVSPGANADLTTQDIAQFAEVIANAKTLGLCLESPLDTVKQAAQVAHGLGTKVVLNFSPIMPVTADLMRLVDVLVVNENELAALASQIGAEPCLATNKTGDIKAIYDRLDEVLDAYKINSGVVTLGINGSLISDHGEHTTLNRVEVTTVDSTGCGDAYLGTLLAGIASEIKLADAGALASCVAALGATKLGAQSSYPSLAEIYRFLR